MAIAVTFAHIYINPTDASSGMGYEHSTDDTIVDGTIESSKISNLFRGRGEKTYLLGELIHLKEQR
jgi:hypothetical protein